jgi:aryl-alcohol dehydrogenase-like predicted oxidoreductase
MGTPLPTATLGRTGLEVTRLGFGTALSSPERPHWNDAAAQELLHQVLDAGITFIDTAYDYVDAERRIGESLGSRYGEFSLATKCGCTDTRPTQNSSDHVWTRENLFHGLDGSLARLHRDDVDIMQLHNPTVAECESGKLVEALTEMKESGRVRWIGVSTTLPHLPIYLGWGVFDVMQIPYSALERQHEEWISRAAEAGVGIIVRGGIAQGEPGAGRGSGDRWSAFERAGLDELRADGESRSAFVLRYALAHPHVHTIIVGTTRPEHLAANVEATRRGALSETLYAEAKRRLAAAGEQPSS